MFVTSDQLAKSELCCKTKFVDGIVHESWMSFAGAMFNVGEAKI